MKKIVDLHLNIVKLPVPILRHPDWAEVKYPKNFTERDFIYKFKQNLQSIKKFAETEKVKQMKVAVNPDWDKLANIGLNKTVYYVTIKPSELQNLHTIDAQVSNISEPNKIKQLIKEQFIYHCKYNPAYFTCETIKRTDWFIDLTRKNIKQKIGFILAARYENQNAGFIYGELYQEEGCIDELFIREEFRRKGLGKLLLKRASEQFKKMDINIISAFVGVKEESLGFYEKIGFKKEFANWIINLD